MSAPQWRQFQRFTDPKLLHIIKTLPDVIGNSRSTNTVKNYVSSFRRFKTWASASSEVTAFPADDVSVLLYLLSLVQRNRSVATLNMTKCAISWMHRTSGYPDPTESSIVKTILDGGRRSQARPVQGKEPISPRIIRKLKKYFLRFGRWTLETLRLFVIILIGFAAFLRFNEIARLTCECIRFHKNYVSIFLTHSKTD